MLFPSDALATCDGNGLMVGLSAASGLGAGAATSLASAGIISASDDTRDYDFGLAVGASIGVTGGLSLIYAIVDGSSGCAMVEDQGGFAWTVPLTMGVLGSLLPIAIWGASDEVEPSKKDPPPTGMMSLTFRF